VITLSYVFSFLCKALLLKKLNDEMYYSNQVKKTSTVLERREVPWLIKVLIMA